MTQLDRAPEAPTRTDDEAPNRPAADPAVPASRVGLIFDHKPYQRSPKDHLTHLRLRRAGTMRRSSPERREEIADQAGYPSVGSFPGAFRRWSGIPAARFRRGGPV